METKPTLVKIRKGARAFFKNSEFSGGEQSLDDAIWEDCIFENCKIVVEQGNFTLTRCKFIKCSLRLEGRAANVIKLVELFSKSVVDENVESQK